MEILNRGYKEAVEKAKNDLLNDIYLYMEESEAKPELEEYLDSRERYMNQIWNLAWKSKTLQRMNKNEKVKFLELRGIDTNGASKKTINKMVEQELIGLRFFDLKSWILDYFDKNNGQWDELFETVKLKRRRENYENTVIKDAALLALSSNKLKFYLELRYKIANYMHKEITTLDAFNQKEYETLNDLFYWGYHDYHVFDEYIYRDILTMFMYEVVYPSIIVELPTEVKSQYEIVFKGMIDPKLIRQLIGANVNEIQWEYENELEQELIDDLLEVQSKPNEFDTQLFLYHKQHKERALKKEKKLEEMRKREEEKQRKLEDIFGIEYKTTIYRNTKYILHIGDTNTGKTYQALKRLKQAKSGIYLAPLRLLALEVYETLRSSGIACALKTGEEEKNIANATHYSCTIEMFTEREKYDVIVIDEAQLIADPNRGFSWFRAIHKANAQEVHIIGSYSSKSMILNLLQGNDIEIQEYKRDIPLIVEKKPFKIEYTKPGDALIVFSRNKVLQTASRLERNGHKVSVIYGSMPPETRAKQMERFIKKETKVIVATDAIGMGLNLPIRRVVFLENDKFDGTRRRLLTSQEVKQLAGRAGRKGIYNEGRVAFTDQISLMKRLLNSKDRPINTFTIAPTQAIFERFKRYHASLEHFFELWEEFKNPVGTMKAPLTQEKELYQLIRHEQIEGRMALDDLYGFLHLPFSANEDTLVNQWLYNMRAIVDRRELREPLIKKGSLDELEMSYKSVGLHLLFLYKLDRRSETVYWERIREEISLDAHAQLRKGVKKFHTKCKSCQQPLSWNYPFSICQSCYEESKRSRYYYYKGRDI